MINLCNDVFSPPKPYRFFNIWTKHAGILVLVKSSWEVPIKGSSMVILFEKLKRLKPILKEFNQNNFDNISKIVAKKRKELASVQNEVLRSVSIELVYKMKKLSIVLNKLMLDEKCFYKQKSRIDWIFEEYQNTTFFS